MEWLCLCPRLGINLGQPKKHLKSPISLSISNRFLFGRFACFQTTHLTAKMAVLSRYDNNDPSLANRKEATVIFNVPDKYTDSLR